MDVLFLQALRRLHDDADAALGPTELARSALSALAQVAPASRLVFRHSVLDGPVVLDARSEADRSCGVAASREWSFPDQPTPATLLVERSAPLDGAASEALELLCGVLVQRLRHEATAVLAKKRARQQRIMFTLARIGAESVASGDLSDRAALALMEAFDATHVAVHVARGRRLELVARRTSGGEAGLEVAPEWLRTVDLDGTMLQARAARDRTIYDEATADLRAEARAVMDPLGIARVVAAPLVFNDTLVGMLAVASSSQEPRSKDELDLFASAASQLAMALSSATLFEDERRRSADLALVHEVGTLVSQHLDLNAILSTVVHRLAAIADAPRIDLLLIDDARTKLTSAAYTMPELGAVTLDLSSPSLSASAFREKRPIVAEDPPRDERVSQGLVKLVGARAVLAVPLVSRSESIGVIVLVETRRDRRFTEAEVARAVAVANLVAPAIANAKMYDDLKRSYVALARAQADLVTHERLAALGELSAVMAHEVRNPLAVIFNSLGALRRVVEPTPDAELLLSIVGEEAMRLNRIVGDLLDFVKPYSCHPRPAHLHSIVHSAVDAARCAAPTSAVHIETELSVPMNEVGVDAHMLQRALTNLILNAIQAMPKGGIVRVRATHLGESTRRVRFEVDDEGPGIEPSDAGRIFQPFFTTKATGTGLGLAVVKRIADALSGEVAVAPCTPQGARFSLVVPLEDVDVAPPTS